MVLYTLNLLACFFVVLAAAVSRDNEPVKVNIRIEGDVSTLYDGDISTQGHIVNPISQDKHLCDGTNNKAHPHPVPVATAALDDASKAGNFIWNGTWSLEYEDYFVTQIDHVPASTSTTLPKYWFLYVNYTFAQKGGCQLEVKEGDQVLWAFCPSEQIALRLDGPTEVVVNSPNRFHVTDGSNGNPIADVTVDFGATDGNGDVWLTFPNPGVQNLKGEKSGTIRSNTLQVNVSPGLVVNDPENQMAMQDFFKE